MLEELYRDLRDELIRWCTTMTQDRSTAEDLVQEAFWKAINNEAMLQTMTPPQRRAWLYQVVKNLFIDRTRHAAYEAVMEELPETAGDELPSEYDSLLSQDLLRHLPEDERVLFVLRYIEGYNSTELGKLFFPLTRGGPGQALLCPPAFKERIGGLNYGKTGTQRQLRRLRRQKSNRRNTLILCLCLHQYRRPSEQRQESAASRALFRQRKLCHRH